MRTDVFALRHIGPRPEEKEQMLEAIGADSIDQLIYETLPDGIKLQKPLNLEAALSEYEYATHINALANKNKLFKTYIGLGYHESKIPAVIQRV